MGALSPDDRAAQVFPPTVPPDQARAQNQTTGPNGLIERQVTKELMDLFNIDEQTLNTEGLQVTTTIDPKAQKAAEDAVDRSTWTARIPTCGRRSSRSTRRPAG